MSSGTNALTALLGALDSEIEETFGGKGTGTLRAVRRAVLDAIKGCEDQDYYDYMGEDM